MRTITFDYNGHALNAHVYCDFKCISDLIAIVPKKNKYLNEPILLFKEQGQWISDLLFQKDYPATLKNLIASVQKSFGI